jgi:hypothetical protein
MYYDLGVKYTYSVELRDRGIYGFLAPVSYIVPSGYEMTEAMIKVFKMIASIEDELLLEKKDGSIQQISFIFCTVVILGLVVGAVWRSRLGTNYSNTSAFDEGRPLNLFAKKYGARLITTSDYNFVKKYDEGEAHKVVDFQRPVKSSTLDASGL